jgi:hypothetical protein
MGTTGRVFGWALLAALAATSCRCVDQPGEGGSGRVGASPTLTTSTMADGGPGGGDAGVDGAFMHPCSELPAAPEAVPAGYPAGAKRLPALPAQVEVFEVPAPSALLQWADCGTGCKELVTSWADAGSGPLTERTIGGLVNGEPWFALRQVLPGSFVRTWIGPLGGPAAKAFVERLGTGNVDTGFLEPLSLVASGGIFAVFYHDEFMYVFTTSVAGNPVCTAWRGKPTFVPFSAAISAGRWAIAGSPAPIVTGAWPVVAGQEDIRTLTTPSGDELNDVGSAGEWLFWGGFGGDQRFRLWGWRPLGNVELLVQPPSDVAADLCCAAAGSESISWLRGLQRYDDNGVARWKQVDLVTLALPIHQVPIAGMLVRQVPQDVISGPGVTSPRYWASFGHDPGSDEMYAYVVRLSDGQLWKIPRRGPNAIWLRALYVSSQEIALLEKEVGSYSPYSKTVVRYDLSSLGPGEPAGQGGQGP